MSTAVLSTPPTILQFLNNLGQPNAGGSILTQVGGVNYPTYQDSAGNTPLPNPIPLNSRGEVSNSSGVSCQLFLAANVTYTFTLYDANGNQINQALSVTTGAGSGTIVDSNVSPSAAINASKLSFLQNGAGAVARTVLSKEQDIFSVADFGASPSASAAVNTTAFNAASSAANAAGGGTVYIPAGTWNLSGTVTTYPNVEFVGSGEFSTILVPITVNMTLFSISNSVATQVDIGFRNMTISPNVTGVTGIKMVLCKYAAVTNITFLGCQTNVYIDRGYFFTLSNLTSTSINSSLAAGGTTLTSTVDTDYVFHATISNYKLVSQGLGAPNVGLYMRRAIDCLVTDLHAYGVAPNCTVIVLENDSQAVKFKGLNIDGCAAGVTLQQGSGVAVTPTFTSISNSHIDQPSAFGIQLNSASWTTITDVMFTPVAAHVNAVAVSLNNDSYTVVTGCIFSGFGGSPTGAGIQTSGGTQRVIEGNIFYGCYIGVGYSSTTYTVVRNNQFPGCNFPIAGSPAGAGNAFVSNANATSPGNLSVALPASGTAAQNSTGYDALVLINGGTVSGININGVGTSLTQGSFQVKVGESITVTYSVAPNYTWIGQI